MRFTLLGVVLCGLSTACGAGERSEPHARIQQAISGGQTDAIHESVFLEIAHTSVSTGLCSGTLIAKNLILTARHCVSKDVSEQVVCGDSAFGGTIAPEGIFATNDAILSDSSDFYGAEAVRVPSEGNDNCGFDMALIILSENVESSVAEPSVPRIDREVKAGEEYSAVGYGQTSDNSETAGVRMVRDHLEIQCAPADCHSDSIESTEFLGETGICSGDSGGPALDAEGRVVGVVSRGAEGCASPVYSTVTAWRDWLMETALEAADRGAYEPPRWATTGSSDVPPDEAPAGGASGMEEAGLEGTSCAASNDCQAGLVCYYDADPKAAACRALCSTTADCSGSQACRSVGDQAVCLEPSGSADEGCTLARSHAPSTQGYGAWGLGLALAGLARRRSRKALS